MQKAIDACSSSCKGNLNIILIDNSTVLSQPKPIAFRLPEETTRITSPSANAMAIAHPRPRVPPVTTAVFPASEKSERTVLAEGRQGAVSDGCRAGSEEESPMIGCQRC
ncbi:predicted protein [Histoplasma capsulatum H143]|uniref:Uncharacterized protein n=1 Tax=Ajellomyces capsulatus (strain H143) TaxID=544712 RepID=C6HNQ2_AJECH|nr:predicted protein [Histoplasma capsulatum H143]